MTFFKKLFGREQPSKASDTAAKPEMVRAYDPYGRELLISKQDWRDKVLLGSLEGARNDPEKLYDLLAGALKDGFAEHVVPYAEHLHRNDPNPARGANLLGVVYLELKRLDDAERILRECLERHGDDGWVLLNLAKVYDQRGNPERAEAIVWRALEVDPNQDIGFGWYTQVHRDRGGEPAALEAIRRVAKLPRSWRARLWLARDALQRKQLEAAASLYEEALELSDRPIPADLLMQMSGDLGNSGNLDTIVKLVGPHFDPMFHGLLVGNNLIKANLDLRRIDEAKHILDQLYALKRPDWREGLEFWSAEMAKSSLQVKAGESDARVSVVLFAVQGPLWMRGDSPFAALLPAKGSTSKCVAVFGSTVLLADPPPRVVRQLSDAPGRMSRALPLVLAEQIHLGSTAVGTALIPWAQGQGFALFGKPYEDREICQLVSKGSATPSFVASVLLDATDQSCELTLRLLRVSDAALIGTAKVRSPQSDAARAMEELSLTLMHMLTERAGIEASTPPSWYQRPQGIEGSDYLLRLEQQLAVDTSSPDSLKGASLSGEHEIIEGGLQLCVRNPNNATTRMLFAQTLRAMKKVRPHILPAYKDRSELLQREYPILGNVGVIIERVISEAFAP